MAEYGYVRVSSKEQNEDRQVIALHEAGVDNLFIDKQSGKNFDRPEYKKMLRKLKPDDVVFVKSIDRFGRNYDEILKQWRILTKERKVAIVVLDMPLLDTRKGRDLTGTLIADIVLQLLSYVAQTEREFIRQRQAEGIAAAKARGVQFGRRPKPLPENYQENYEKWKNKEISQAEAARRCGMPLSTFRYTMRRDTIKEETMKMFSDCSGECCVCFIRKGCLAGHGDDYFCVASKDEIIRRLDENEYLYYREFMVEFLKNHYNYDYENERKAD